jgi:hypothetical protein
LSERLVVKVDGVVDEVFEAGDMLGAQKRVRHLEQTEGIQPELIKIEEDYDAGPD